ncbi:MAG: hypothetical protein OJF51_003332 [Nitrospira sp.]|nr:MAG: hypothetical protein OJF51_003332 [Nitrospira sp.]
MSKQRTTRRAETAGDRVWSSHEEDAARTSGLLRVIHPQEDARGDTG